MTNKTTVSASTSRMNVAYMIENEWGVTPNTKLQEITPKSQSLGINKTTAESAAIRADRNVADIIDTGIEAAGNIDFILSYKTFDDFFAASLFNEWSSQINITSLDGDIRLLASGNQIIHDPPAPPNEGGDKEKINFSSLENKFSGIKVGQWLKLSGFKSENNGYCKVETNTGTQITVSGINFVDDKPAGNEAKIQGSYLRNGVRPKSFTIERQHQDIGQYFLFSGMMPSSMALNFPIGAEMDGSITFLGKDGIRQSSSVSADAPLPAPSTNFFNNVTNFASLRISGSDSKAYLQSLSLNIDNGLRGQKAIANVGLVGVGLGKCSVSGKIDAFFWDESLYDAFRHSENISLDWRITDSTGATYIFTLPNVKLSKGEIDAGGGDAEVIAKFDFTAILDKKTQCSIQIDKFDA